MVVPYSNVTVVEEPFAFMVPVSVAVVLPRFVTISVVAEGVVQIVVKITWFPYEVPASFVAYALTLYIVFANKLVILLVKLPIPVPFNVLKLFMVGSAVVDQQTPLAVTDPSPLVVILPPETAVVEVIEVMVLVVSVDNIIWLVVKATSFPYPIPSSFVAYAAK